MKIKFLILFFFVAYNFFAQENCNIYTTNVNKLKACDYYNRAIEYPQGSVNSQLLFDSAIAICPSYAIAYYEKSVPYSKRGYFHEGITILSKAVELEPNNYLHYRAAWYYTLLDYTKCKNDLEEYYKLKDNIDVGTPGGEFDMRILLGVCYFELGEPLKGIEIIKSRINTYKNKDQIRLYDYLILGILQLKNNQPNDAISSFKQEMKYCKNYLDTHYYLGLAFKAKHNYKKSKKNFKIANDMFKSGKWSKRDLPYPVYLSDIERELSLINK